MTCAQCQHEVRVSLGMAPGHDQTPWVLCVPCYIAGRRTKPEGDAAATVVATRKRRAR